MNVCAEVRLRWILDDDLSGDRPQGHANHDPFRGGIPSEDEPGQAQQAERAGRSEGDATKNSRRTASLCGMTIAAP